MNENLLNRSFDSKKEANSLDILNQVNENYKIKQWTVKEVGLVNLKNGLNENYSDITKIGKAQNTLLKNNEGDYVLIKGNLQEATQKGTKAELLENRKTKIVSYGNFEVVGKYDNTLEGLGDVMYESKKSAIPLLFFKG